MTLGKFLDRMDKVYYHRDHRPLGYIFCELLDYYYGKSARSILKETARRQGRFKAALLLGPLALVKAHRVKWDLSNPVRRKG